MSLEIFEQRTVGPLACNCYIVGDRATRRVVVIDPGGDADELARAIADNDLEVTAIVATHAHFDHIVAAERLRALTGARFHLHGADEPLLDWYQESGRLFLGLELPPPPEVDATIDEGDRFEVGDATLEVLHTPGHSPGSVALVASDAIFSGDLLFAGSVGRTDLPGGDGELLLRAIKQKLFALADDLPVYPGHGPPTTLARERRFNPFVGSASRLWVPGT